VAEEGSAAVPVTVEGSALVEVTEEVASLEGATREPEKGGEVELEGGGDVGEERLSSERDERAGAEGVFCSLEATDNSLRPCWLVEGLAAIPSPSLISAANCSELNSTPLSEVTVTDVEAEAAGCCVIAGGGGDAPAGGE
jgi:hypothetical protein